MFMLLVQIISNDSIYFCFIGIVKRISRWAGRVGVFVNLVGTVETATTGAEARTGLVALMRPEAPLFYGITGICVVLFEHKGDPCFLRPAGAFCA
jgi:hypothetical protein